MSITQFLALALALWSCTSAHASSAIITDEFVQILKDNAKDKAAGTQDPRRFFDRLSEVANKGDPSAQFLMGLTLLKADPGLARRYLSSSAISGCAGSETALGLLEMLSKNFNAGIEHFQKAAALGDTTAQVALSGLHERGEHGFKASFSNAYAWLRIAEVQTVSAGALAAIKQGKVQLERKMSADELSDANGVFVKLKSGIPSVGYYFCGQFNLETNLAPDIPYYYKIQ